MTQKQADSRKFTVYYSEEEEGGYSGYCAELPGAISQGETIEELEENMIDAIQLILASMRAEADAKKKMVIEVPVVA